MPTVKERQVKGLSGQLKNLNPKDPANFKKLDVMYLGANIEAFETSI